MDGGLAVAIVVLVGILGLLVGSFLNVVIHRVPAGESIVSPPSACPTCGERIKARDNVPLVSWLLLRGRCRNCQAPISRRYPIVELATGLLFAAAAFRFMISPDAPASVVVASILLLVAFLYFAAISVALTGIDLDTHRLPNSIVLPAYIVVAVLLVAASAVYGDLSQLVQAAIGGAALFAAYYVMALVYPGGMGMGDVKLAGVIGLLLGFLGWGTLIVGAFSAFVLGGLFGAVLLLRKKATRKSGIPFGPWMLAGAWLGIFIGERIWNGYLGLFELA
jgi:leader peptidase (prepilin peptidase)/N-methyltransferase